MAIFAVLCGAYMANSFCVGPTTFSRLLAQMSDKIFQLSKTLVIFIIHFLCKSKRDSLLTNTSKAQSAV